VVNFEGVHVAGDFSGLIAGRRAIPVHKIERSGAAACPALLAGGGVEEVVYEVFGEDVEPVRGDGIGFDFLGAYGIGGQFFRADGVCGYLVRRYSSGGDVRPVDDFVPAGGFGGGKGARR
jgi:hypothetical protein